MLVRVYTCQNITVLEIICHSSSIFEWLLKTGFTILNLSALIFSSVFDIIHSKILSISLCDRMRSQTHNPTIAVHSCQNTKPT